MGTPSRRGRRQRAKLLRYCRGNLFPPYRRALPKGLALAGLALARLALAGLALARFSGRVSLASSLWKALSGRLSLTGSLWQDSLWQGSLWKGSGFGFSNNHLGFSNNHLGFSNNLEARHITQEKLASGGLKRKTGFSKKRLPTF